MVSPLHKKLAFIALFGLTGVFSKAQNNPVTGLSWTTNPFAQDAFVENKGQYSIPAELTSSKPLAAARQEGLQILFSKEGIVYTCSGAPDKQKDKAAPSLNKLGMQWIGANPYVKVILEDTLGNYFVYTDHADIRANAFRKISYKNLYPNIDVEYAFVKDQKEMQCTVLLHPEADPALLKMKYSGDIKKIILEKDKQVKVLTTFGEIILHAPVAKNQTGTLASDFQVSGKTLSYQLDKGYDTKQNTTIETKMPEPSIAFAGRRYEIRNDHKGNVYVFGGSFPCRLLKLNPQGVLQWTCANVMMESVSHWTLDETTGTSYFAEEVNKDPKRSPRIVKINTNGEQAALFPGDDRLHEIWGIAFQTLTHQFLVAGGNAGGGYINQAILDTGLTGFSNVNILPLSKGMKDKLLLVADKQSNMYMEITSLRGDTTEERLLKLSASLKPVYNISGKRSFWETGKKSRNEKEVSAAIASADFTGVAMNCNYVYVYDGLWLKKIRASNGEVLLNKKVDKNVIPYRHGAIAVDDCDHLFVSMKDSICQLDSLLNRVDAIRNYTADGLILSKGVLYGCGDGFASSFPVTASCVPVGSTKAFFSMKGLSGCAPFQLTFESETRNADSLYWDFGDGKISHAGNPSHVYALPGKYKVRLLAYNKNPYPCSSSFDSASKVIVIPEALKSEGRVESQCDLKRTAITQTVNGGSSPVRFLWSNGARKKDIENMTPGKYSVKITDSLGCVIRDTFSVPAHVKPEIVSISADKKALDLGAGTRLHVKAKNTTSFQWEPAQDITGPGTPDPEVHPKFTSTYFVKVFNDGCTAKDSIVITVNRDVCNDAFISVPKSFSPNGDHKGDTLFVKGQGIQSLYMSVYNKSGEKVFESYTPEDGWDGTNKGFKEPAGEYTYTLKVGCMNNEEYVKKGNITLTR